MLMRTCPDINSPAVGSDAWGSNWGLCGSGVVMGEVVESAWKKGAIAF